jgi:hypothetical protein
LNYSQFHYEASRNEAVGGDAESQAYYLQKVKENCKEHFKAKREL